MMDQPNSVTVIEGDTPIAAAFALILGERLRQQDAGYTPSHDQEHTDDELIFAGIAMATRAAMPTRNLPSPESIWPFWESMPPRKTNMRDLVIATSLLAAEIERRLTLDE